MAPWKAFVDGLPRGPRPARARPVRMVAFDLDGVLLDQASSWVAVHRHYGVDNEDSLHAFLRGEIDDDEFIRRDVALWTGARPGLTLAEVDDILRRDLTLVRDAQPTVARLRDEGIECVIVSGGLEAAARETARKLGIQRVSANSLLAGPDGRLTGHGVVGTPLGRKDIPLRRFARQAGVPLGHVASVGNSSPDVSMFRASGLGIAFRPTDEPVQAWADVVLPGVSLSEILGPILGEGPPAAGARQRV